MAKRKDITFFGTSSLLNVVSTVILLIYECVHIIILIKIAWNGWLNRLTFIIFTPIKLSDKKIIRVENFPIWVKKWSNKKRNPGPFACRTNAQSTELPGQLWRTQFTQTAFWQYHLDSNARQLNRINRRQRNSNKRWIRILYLYYIFLPRSNWLIE